MRAVMMKASPPPPPWFFFSALVRFVLPLRPAADKRRRCVSCTHTLPAGDQTQTDVLCYCRHKGALAFCRSGTLLLVFASSQVTDETSELILNSAFGGERMTFDILLLSLETCVATLLQRNIKAQRRFGRLSLMQDWMRAGSVPGSQIIPTAWSRCLNLLPAIH